MTEFSFTTESKTSLLRIVATGLLAFVGGLAVNLYRSSGDAPDAELRGPEEDAD